MDQTPKKAEQNIDKWKNRITVVKPFDMDHRYKNTAKVLLLILLNYCFVIFYNYSCKLLLKFITK